MLFYRLSEVISTINRISPPIIESLIDFGPISNTSTQLTRHDTTVCLLAANATLPWLWLHSGVHAMFLQDKSAKENAGEKTKKKEQESLAR